VRQAATEAWQAADRWIADIRSNIQGETDQ
jgi:hypothetical protein